MLWTCIALFAPVAAHAAVINRVLCPSCVTRADFKNAAKAWYGNRSQQLKLFVGNPVSGDVYGMWIKSSSAIPLMLNPVLPANIVVGVDNSHIVTSDEVRSMEANEVGAIQVSRLFFNTTESEYLLTMVKAVKNVVVIYPTPSQTQSGSFDSFASNSSVAVCDSAWLAKGAASPGWNYQGPTSWLGDLESLFGYGPSVSVIFANGDVATYQVNPLDNDACRYVRGTAKDRRGKKLPDDEGSAPIGNAGSHEGIPVSYLGDHSWYQVRPKWLECWYIGEVLQSCEIKYAIP